jgi:hypothetical protein
VKTGRKIPRLLLHGNFSGYEKKSRAQWHAISQGASGEGALKEALVACRFNAGALAAVLESNIVAPVDSGNKLKCRRSGCDQGPA